MMLKDLILLGAGGFGREVAWLIDDLNLVKKEWNLIGFLDQDQNKHGLILNSYPVINFEDLKKYKGDLYAVCAVGDPKIKKQMIEEAKSNNLKFVNLIHPSVISSNYITYGEGVIICACNILTVNIRIGNHVIINLDCTVGHDVIIENFCTLSPSANISGNVEIKTGCDIGTNASIIQGKRIGEWSKIGAGAVVVNDIPDYCTAVGVPARVVKESTSPAPLPQREKEI